MTNNTRNTTIGALGFALAGLVLSGSAFAMKPLAQGYMVATSHAAAEGKCGEGRFAQTDTDDDGRVSKAEFLAVVPNGDTYFAQIDKSSDGYISEKEAYDNVKRVFESNGKKVPVGLFARYAK